MTASYSSFDIVLVPFPFSDTPEVTKPRPALVLSTAKHRRTGQVIVAMITSSEAPQWSGDVSIDNWSEVGLPKPSKIRTAKLATFDQNAVHKKIGSLGQEDRVTVKTCLRDFLDY